MKLENLIEYSSKTEIDNYEYWKSRRDFLVELLNEEGFSIEGNKIVDKATDRLICPRCKTVIYSAPGTHLSCDDCQMEFRVDQRRKYVIFP